MKDKWNNIEIKKLFSLVEQNNEKNIPALDSFKQYSQMSNRNAFSVRNFYYDYVKILNNNQKLCKQLDIDLKKHKVEKFKHFNLNEQIELKNKIDDLKKNGQSTRSACLQLSGGDIKKMLRIQNKYRNLTTKVKVFNFPKQNKSLQPTMQKLTDDEIKSLFMGLVKLVKENAQGESKQIAKQYLEQTEEEKRKKIILLEEKQEEIKTLKNAICDLKNKNNKLNNMLKHYRIDYIQNYNRPNDNNI